MPDGFSIFVGFTGIRCFGPDGYGKGKVMALLSATAAPSFAVVVTASRREIVVFNNSFILFSHIVFIIIINTTYEVIIKN